MQTNIITFYNHPLAPNKITQNTKPSQGNADITYKISPDILFGNSK